MSSKMVWSRFEVIGKYGKVHKLRIQDLPSARISDALDLFMNVFVKEEALFKAVDILSNPAAVKNLTKYYDDALRDPSFHKVICCSDDTDDVKDIMSVTMMRLCTDTMANNEHELYLKVLNSPEKFELNSIKLIKMIHELKMSFDPIKEFKLDSFFEDQGAVIAPDYRGLGILKHYDNVKRTICKAHKVQMTGAWMTARNAQKAAAQVGWETVHEIAYDYFAKKYDLNFTNVPPTIKFMIMRANSPF